MVGREQPRDGAGFAPVASTTEKLSYLCDIIYDLKLMADTGGYRTLSAILGAALVEAHIQNEDTES
jgi:hypothetical protein